jgi:polyhydroxybutyrate depolymerase
MRYALPALLTLTLSACADPSAAPAPVDASQVAQPDATQPDANQPDANQHDANQPDANQPDANQHDATQPDAGPPDLPDTLGGDRPAAIQLPAGYDARQPVPLIVLLGGYWNLATDLDDWLGTRQYVDDLGFALLLPDGLIDSEGAPYWHATDTCCDFDDSGVDDVAYLTGLITEAKTRLNIDPSRVILVGHSNGGFMAYRMACDLAEHVTAVVSMAGSGWLEDGHCAPSRPVSILQVHGTLDEVMPYAGDDTAPGVDDLLARWATRNHCAADRTQSPAALELIDDDRPDETTEWIYNGCAAPTDTRLWLLDGSDHYPAFSWAYTERMLGWALSHPRP